MPRHDADGDSTTPQPTVADARPAEKPLIIRRTRLAGQRPKKSITVVEASEFSAALRLAMAAARMAAITKPGEPGRKLVPDEFRINAVDSSPARGSQLRR